VLPGSDVSTSTVLVLTSSAVGSGDTADLVRSLGSGESGDCGVVCYTIPVQYWYYYNCTSKVQESVGHY
jgi:hypothetical protein